MSKRILRVSTLVLLAAVMGGGSPAQASFGFCMEPRAPSLFASRPQKPYCATTHSCEQWQVDSYKIEVTQYFDALQTYLVNVDAYRKKAYEYAQCMADLD